jgi:hypothetical protein
VLFTAVIAPALEIVCLLAVVLALHRPPAPHWVGMLLRGYELVREWSMIEIMLLGVLVALIKIAELATVIPGLALFYGGLVRAKNILSVLMQVMVGFSLIVVLWCIYGYSLAFSEGSAFIGCLSRLFLDGTFDAEDEELLLALGGQAAQQEGELALVGVIADRGRQRRIAVAEHQQHQLPERLGGVAAVGAQLLEGRRGQRVYVHAEGGEQLGKRGDRQIAALDRFAQCDKDRMIGFSMERAD